MKCIARMFAVILCGCMLCVSVHGSGPDMPQDRDVMTAAEVHDEPPAVSAKAVILTDADGSVLWAHNADSRLPMASTTKIMTALTVLAGGMDLDAPVTIPAEAVGVEGSSVYLYEGEQLTARQLFDAVLMESANDAATALAIAYAGSTEAFADRMNAQAAAMGLCGTHFVNPHGLDDAQHYTTARELAAIARAAMEYDVFAETAATYKKEIPLKGGEGVRLLINHNKLLKTLDGCIGIKTGFTKTSGRCLVSACERDGVRLYCVTLNAPDDWADHRALYDWGFAQVECVTLTEDGALTASLPVVGGALPDGTCPEDGITQTVSVKNSGQKTVILSRGHAPIDMELRLPHFLYAPVQAGTQIGAAVYTCGGEILCEVPLYACETVPCYETPTIRERIARWFSRIFSGKKE